MKPPRGRPGGQPDRDQREHDRGGVGEHVRRRRRSAPASAASDPTTTSTAMNPTISASAIAPFPVGIGRDAVPVPVAVAMVFVVVGSRRRDFTPLGRQGRASANPPRVFCHDHPSRRRHTHDTVPIMHRCA